MVQSLPTCRLFLGTSEFGRYLLRLQLKFTLDGDFTTPYVQHFVYIFSCPFKKLRWE